MAITTHLKVHFNREMVTLIFGIRAYDPLRVRRTTKKAEPKIHAGFSTIAVLYSECFAHKLNSIELNYLVD